MADQPKSTADIIAQIRKQSAAGSGGESASAPQEDQTAALSSAAEQSEQTPAQSAPGAAGEKPQGTSDILAAIRAKGAAKSQGSSEEAEKAPASPAKSAAGGAAPKGTADILAAIRGGGAGAAAPAASKEKSKHAPKPQAPQAQGPTGKLSPQEMLKAIREGVKADEGQGVPKPPRLPAVRKPSAAKKDVTRRSALASIGKALSTPFVLAWALVAGIGSLWTLATARFMMPNMVLELPSRFKVGVPTDYPLESVSTKFKASRGIWIVHTTSYDGRNLIYALAAVCTHLGCTPSWLGGERKFKCPCHGSGFYINGVNFEGPAPRPLERVGIRVAEDGQLEVDKSLKFQEELGQWSDPKSFVEVV